MKKLKKDIDLVVIFERIDSKNNGTIFKPKYITTGSFDEETLEFVDWKTNARYNHLLTTNDVLGSPYKFGLRMNLEELEQKSGSNNIRDILNYYSKYLKAKRYCFTFVGGYDMKHLSFVSLANRYGDMKIEEDKDIEKFWNLADPFLDINKLISNIKDNVIGQDEAIEEIITILWKNSRKENKSNILLIGPTGVGKTEILRQVSKYLDIPVIIEDVSSITQTGYKGNDVDSILKNALLKYNNDISKVENSIIVLDEFDKLANTDPTNGSVATLGVQQELLKLVEDGEYVLEMGDDIFSSQKVTINTKGITFVFAGAFSDLFKEKKVDKVIGFNNVTPKVENKKITNEDIIKYGFMSELVGRLHNIVILNSLTKENLISIMKSPNNYMLNDNIKLFSDLGINVNIQDGVYDKIANVALDKKIGARGLVSTIDSLFSKASLDAKRHVLDEEYNYLEISEETVLDNSKYVLKKVIRKEK